MTKVDQLLLTHYRCISRVQAPPAPPTPHKNLEQIKTRSRYTYIYLYRAPFCEKAKKKTTIPTPPENLLLFAHFSPPTSLSVHPPSLIP